MKKIFIIIFVFLTVSVFAVRFVDIGLQVPYRTGANGQIQKIIQDKYLRAVKSLWIPYTNSTTPNLNGTIDSVGNGFQLLSNGRFAISKGLTTGFFQYPNIDEVNSLIAGAGTGGTVTSITPGFGFNSATPITTSGTLTLDTVSSIRSFANSFSKAEVNSQISSLSIRNQTATNQSASFRISGAGQLAKLGIGSGATATVNFDNRANITGGGTAYGAFTFASVQPDVTTIAYGHRIQLNFAASAVNARANVFSVSGGTLGAGASNASAAAYNVESTFTTGTENMAFRGGIASSTGRWNIYMDGTALNYMNGNLLLATTTDSGDKLNVNGAVRATQFKLSALNTAPASATATGTLGEIRVTNGYVYFCVATNVWLRCQILTW